MFEIHTRLKENCISIGKFNLSHLMLMNDSNFPWFILVPEREGIKEIFQLSAEDQMQLIYESSYLSKKIYQIFSADKLNVAALGNMVPQLHIHHIVRYKTDSAWPGPVWGKVPAKKYSSKTENEIKSKIKDAFFDIDFLWD